MATEQVRYVVTLDDARVISGFRNMEGAATSFESALSSVNNTLRGIGVGFGVYELARFGKDAIQGAADFETAMIRIKNASQEGLGVFNQDFLKGQVDNFKLKLQETADAYGTFLLKIKNAGLENSVANRLFENLNIVSKAGGIPQGKMDAVINDLGILLGEGVLEARHLRALSYVNPQIVPYLAEAMGIKGENKEAFAHMFKDDVSELSAQQEFSRLISSGKLTKAALDPRVLITAFENYRQKAESGLPEALNSIQSGINEVSNAWLNFKNELVGENKDEILGLFHGIQEAIHWIKDNKDVLLHLAEILLAIKTYSMAMRALGGIFGLGGVAELSAATAGTRGYTAAIIELTEALTVLSATNVEAAATSSLLVDKYGFPMAALADVEAISAGSAVATNAAIQGTAASRIAAGATGLGVATGAAIIQGALAVYIAGSAIDLLGDFLPKYGDLKFDNKTLNNPVLFAAWASLALTDDGVTHGGGGADSIFPYKSSAAFDANFWSKGGVSATNMGGVGGMKLPNLKAETDKVTGQRVLTVNIDIDKMIGVNSMNVSSKDEVTDSVGDALLREMLSVLNDSQIQSSR